MALPAGEISAGEKEYVSLLPPSSLPLSSKEKKLQSSGVLYFKNIYWNSCSQKRENRLGLKAIYN